MSANPPPPSAARFDQLRQQAGRAVDTARLSQTVRDLAGTSDRVAQLPADVADLRRRGYVFASYLEHKLDVLAERWQAARRDAQAGLDAELERLRPDLREVEVLLDKGASAAQHPAVLESVLPRLEREIASLESAISAAETRLKSHYESVKRDVDQTVTQLADIKWVVDEADEASFDFLAGENLFLAAEAEWQQSGKGNQDPDGLIYLTDQRLIFEQKEKTGKKLGLFGGKQTQELEWAIPLNQVEQVEAENQGLFGGKDLLHFTMGAGAPFARTTVEVKGKAKSKFWAAQIERMIRGETNDERAIAPDAETLETLHSAPTACHVCGATLPMLVANQRQLECRYCGTVIRV